MTLDPTGPVYGAYRSVVAARPAPAEAVSEDRVRIARLDDDFDSLRSLLARLARVERTLVPVAAGLAATRQDAAAMALSAVAANHAAGVDCLVRYWTDVVDGEEHARGNDLTGLASDRWLEGDEPHGLDAPATSPADSTTDLTALERYLRGEALLARGLAGVLAATVDGSVAGLPALPGLATVASGLTAAVPEHVAAVTAATDRDAGAPDPLDDPGRILSEELPAVPAGVPVETVVEESVETYRSAVTDLADEHGPDEN